MLEVFHLGSINISIWLTYRLAHAFSKSKEVQKSCDTEVIIRHHHIGFKHILEVNVAL